MDGLAFRQVSVDGPLGILVLTGSHNVTATWRLTPSAARSASATLCGDSIEGTTKAWSRS